MTQPHGGAASRIYLSPWRIDVTVRPGATVTVPRIVLARAIRAALEAVRAPAPASVGLILSGDAELAELNARAMGRHEATDVLSFPLLPPSAYPAHPGQAAAPPSSSGAYGSFAESAGSRDDAKRTVPDPSAFVPPGHRPHLGDIVVSVERAAAQAREGRGGQTGDVRWSPGDELRLLVTHGALHLCGWDHERPDEEAAMRDLERRLLAER